METLPSIQTSNRPNLLVNGVEPKDWGNIIINGLRTPSFRALPPEQTLDFSYVLGRFFQKPGVYTVGWQGEHFKAAHHAQVAYGHHLQALHHGQEAAKIYAEEQLAESQSGS